MMTYGRVEIQLHILTSALDGGVSGQFHALPPLPLGRRAWYPMDRVWVGLSWSGCGGEQKQIPSLSLLQIESHTSILQLGHYID